MNVGTFVVAAVLVIIVGAIIINMVRSHRAGKHVSCDNCGGCSCGSSQMAAHGAQGGCGCANMDAMIEHMNSNVAKHEGAVRQ